MKHIGRRLLAGFSLAAFLAVGCSRDGAPASEPARAPLAFKASYTRFRAPSVVVETDSGFFDPDRRTVAALHGYGEVELRGPRRGINSEAHLLFLRLEEIGKA
jgi:hypothetical protein